MYSDLQVKSIKLSCNREQNHSELLLKYWFSLYSFLGVEEGCVNTCTYRAAVNSHLVL